MSIVIPNWNGRHFLEECLNSLAQQSYADFEVILVDNGSTDGSIAWLQEHHPQVRCIEFAENRGFSAAVNAGIVEARGKFVALLNNDTEADPCWLAELVGTLEADPRVGFCASLLLRYSDRATIDAAGDGMSRFGLAYKRGSGMPLSDADNREEWVFGACAAASLYRRELFEDVGLFDEEFFAYLEDVDLSFRAQLRGWRCRYVPQAIVYHHVGGTSATSRLSIARMARRVSNKFFVLVKNWPLAWWRMIPFVGVAAIGEFALLVASSVVAPRVFWSQFSNLRLIPCMLRRRRGIQQRVASGALDELARLLSRNYPLNPFGRQLRLEVSRAWTQGSRSVSSDGSAQQRRVDAPRPAGGN